MVLRQNTKLYGRLGSPEYLRTAKNTEMQLRTRSKACSVVGWSNPQDLFRLVRFENLDGEVGRLKTAFVKHPPSTLELPKPRRQLPPVSPVPSVSARQRTPATPRLSRKRLRS